MATKKSKTSNKSKKTNSTKPAAEKSTAKSAAKATVKTELEAPKLKKIEESKDSKKSEETKSKDTKSKSFLSGFFARKYEEKESILTIFKNPKFYGALLGEILGTMLLAFLIFAVLPFNGGVFNMTNYMFPIVAILIAVYAFSGALLNPIITAGMMATRRISVIRGIMYIIAEVIGAWLAWLIFNAFHLAGGETAMDMSKMAAVGEGKFLIVTLVEIIGAVIIGFFFARALKYKRSVFTFAAVVAGGIGLAMLTGYVVSAAFLGLNANYVMNPAVAMMLQIFPTAGENFGEILGGICQALSIYALLPAVGGIVGFYLADFTSRLSDEQ